LKWRRALIKSGKRLSNLNGKNYAPKLLAETPEAKEARVNEAVLTTAMERLLEYGKLEVFDGYRSGRAVHELRVVEGYYGATYASHTLPNPYRRTSPIDVHNVCVCAHLPRSGPTHHICGWSATYDGGVARVGVLT